MQKKKRKQYTAEFKAKVARQMREMGLAAIYPGLNLSQRAQQAAIYPYLLGNITANAPNHIWGLDITYIRLQGGWMYLVAILDWYSRYVVSWELDQTMQVAFVIEAMQRALAQATPQICNSARAVNLAVRSTPSSCSHMGFVLVWIAKDAPSTISLPNACGAVLNMRKFIVNNYASPREACQGLTTYLRFYNEERLHQALDYWTPAEVYFAHEERRGRA